MNEENVSGQFEQPMLTPITDLIKRHREELKDTGRNVRAAMFNEFFKKQIEGDSVIDQGEMKANIMLAYRHIEDARMRLGKVIQAYDGGKSVYDK